MTEHVVGPTSHYYYSQRLKLHYVDWGNTAAPPLLLIHGGRDHARNWDWVALACAMPITLLLLICAGTGTLSGRGVGSTP